MITLTTNVTHMDWLQKKHRHTDEKQDEHMLICGINKRQRQQQTKQRQFKTIWVVVVVYTN